MKINARHTAETKLDYHAWGDKLVSFQGDYYNLEGVENYESDLAY